MACKPGGLLLVVIVLVASILNSSAQGENEHCYPAAGIEVAEQATVRKKYWFRAATDRKVPAGEIFAVKGSRWHDGDCWIQISPGWISMRWVFAAAPPTLVPPSCYNEPHVYLAGQMNIRESHNVNSSLVGQTNAGDLFVVSDTFKGPTYCWLRIESGWIARLGIVQSLDSLRLPRIEGDSRFVAQIRRGLDYLKEQAPHWFLYVVDNVSIVIRSTNKDGFSTAEGWLKRVAIHSKHLRPVIGLASVLVHEACHIIQYKRGDRPSWFDYDGKIRQEKECFRVQRRMVQEIDSDHWYVALLTAILKQPELDWMRYVRGR